MHVASVETKLKGLRAWRPGPIGASARRFTADRRRISLKLRRPALNSNSDEIGSSSLAQKDEPQIRKTMADLDAILGIEPDEEEQGNAKTTTPLPEFATNISPETEEEIRSLAEDVTRKLDEEATSPDRKKQNEFIETMTDIVKRALTNTEGKEGEQKLLEGIEKLLQSVSSKKDEVNEDIKVMKERVFGVESFWVTEVLPMNDQFGGHRFRGNMRSKSERDAFLKIDSKVKELFGDKYQVLMFEEPLSPEQLVEANPKSKPCFQIVRSDQARPPVSASWRPVAVGVLFLFTLATAYILGVSSNVGNIPQPIVEFLSRPENLNADDWPDYVKEWNPTSFLASSAYVGAGVVFLQLMHELGHRVVAFLKKIKLKAPLLLPNTQIGTLGASTQLDSLVKTKQDLWDLSFGGLAAGGLASLVLFVTGVMISQDGSVPQEALIPVPSVLLQGSALIGGLLQTVLGDAAAQRTIFLHPFTIAGWCGLTTTALNTLPVGNLDGGRMMLSAFGRRPLNVSAIFTYAGLGLGLIGGSLALPFGLYILICEREPETYIQDQITQTERTRKWITGIAIAIAVLILVPMGLLDPSESGIPAGSMMI